MLTFRHLKARSWDLHCSRVSIARLFTTTIKSEHQFLEADALSIAATASDTNPAAVIVLANGNHYDCFQRGSNGPLDTDTKLQSVVHYGKNVFTKSTISPSVFPELSLKLSQAGHEVLLLERDNQTKCDGGCRILQRSIPLTSDVTRFSRESENHFTVFIEFPDTMLVQRTNGAKPQKTPIDNLVVGIVWFDLSDGSVFTQKSPIKDVVSHIAGIRPKTIVMSKLFQEYMELELPQCTSTWSGTFKNCVEQLKRYPLVFSDFSGFPSENFSVMFAATRISWSDHLKEFHGIERRALEGALSYMKGTKLCRGRTLQLPQKCPWIYVPLQYEALNKFQATPSYLTVLMDPDTISELGLTTHADIKKKFTSLFSALNRTTTAMGSRCLTNNLLRPSRYVTEIWNRQRIVSFFRNQPDVAEELRGKLSLLCDIPVTIQHLTSFPTSHALLLSVRDSLLILDDLKEFMDKVPKSGTMKKQLQYMFNELDKLKALIDELSRSVKSLDSKPSYRLCKYVTAECFPYSGLSIAIRMFINHQQKFQELATEIWENEHVRGVEFVQEDHQLVARVDLGRNIPQFNDIADQFPSWSVSITNIDNMVELRSPVLLKLQEESLKLYDQVMKEEMNILAYLTKKLLYQSQIIFSLSNKISYLDMLLSFADVSKEYPSSCPKVDLGCSAMKAEEFQNKTPNSETNAKVLEDPLLGKSKISDVSLISKGLSPLFVSGKPDKVYGFMQLASRLALLAHVGAFVPVKSLEIGIVSKLVFHTRNSKNNESNLPYDSQIPELSSCRSLVITDQLQSSKKLNIGEIAKRLSRWSKRGTRIIIPE